MSTVSKVQFHILEADLACLNKDFACELLNPDFEIVAFCLLLLGMAVAVFNRCYH
jgi:hypothetical protein